MAQTLAKRGVKTSGGQKQRLSIARAFLKNPPILIFDEANIWSDTTREKVVQQSLNVPEKTEPLFCGRLLFICVRSGQCQKTLINGKMELQKKVHIRS